MYQIGIIWELLRMKQVSLHCPTLSSPIQTIKIHFTTQRKDLFSPLPTACSSALPILSSCLSIVNLRAI